MSEIKKVIANLEQKKYDILNKMYVISGEGYEKRFTDSYRAQQVAKECEQMFHEAQKIDKALEVLSELEGYDYDVNVVLTETDFVGGDTFSL